ncbi:MAG: aquaporin [Planctomycetota bacterium]
MSERSGPGILGEVIGTFLLVFVGCGVVHTAVTTGALEGSWQVASVWGFAVTLAVFVSGGLGGGHINPAITIAQAVTGSFPWSRVAGYLVAQLAGAALAGVVLFVCFSGTIEAYEKSEGIVRGQPGSEVTASMYGEYFPNPTVGLHKGDDPDLGKALVQGHEQMTTLRAFLIELFATFFLALCVFAVTDDKNPMAPKSNIAPFFVGATVAVMVAIFGPLTQACMNPARDFGPRIVAACCGWGEIAFPGPRGAGATLAVYLAGPIVGAILGGVLYAKVIQPVRDR